MSWQCLRYLFLYLFLPRLSREWSYGFISGRIGLPSLRNYDPMIPYMVLTLETLPSCPELLQYAELLQRTCTLKYIVLQYALQAPFIEEAKFQLQEEQELLQFGTYGVVRCFFWVSIWVFPISERLLSWFDMIWGSTLGIGVCSPDIPLAWVNLHPTPPSWLGEWRHFLNGWFAKSRHWIDD